MNKKQHIRVTTKHVDLIVDASRLTLVDRKGDGNEHNYGAIIDVGREMPYEYELSKESYEYLAYQLTGEQPKDSVFEVDPDARIPDFES